MPHTKLLLLGIFWLLFLVPGFAAYTLFRDHKASMEPKGHLARYIVFSFFFSCILLLPFVAIAFITPVSIHIVDYYMYVLTGCAVVFLAFRYRLRPLKTIRLPATKDALWLGLAALLLAADFIISTKAKGFVVFGGDVWSHLASINHIVHHGFSVYDPYFINNGKPVIDSTHPANFTHLLLALPASILHISALNVWTYSSAFLRAIAFLTVYALVRQLTDNKKVALVAVLLFYLTQLPNEAMLTILYPANQALFASLFLFMLALPLMKADPFKHKVTYGLYALSVLLVSCIHQLQWSLSALVLGSLYLFLLAARKISFKRTLALGAPLVLGFPTALFSLKYAKYIPESVKNMNQDGLFHVSRFVILRPSAVYMPPIILILAFVGLFFSRRYIKDYANRGLAYGILVVGAVLFFTPFLMLINKFIPVWGIERYTYLVNVSLVLLASLPLWFFMRDFGKPNKRLLISAPLLAACLLFIGLYYFKFSSNFHYYGEINAHDYTVARKLSSQAQSIRPGSVVLSDEFLSFLEPGLCDCYVVGIDNTRSTDSLNSLQRQYDTDAFFTVPSESYKKKILDEYNVRYVLINSRFSYIPMRPLGFKKINTVSSYTLYEKSD